VLGGEREREPHEPLGIVGVFEDIGAVERHLEGVLPEEAFLPVLEVERDVG
jgi:hypothetical protein